MQIHIDNSRFQVCLLENVKGTRSVLLSWYSSHYGVDSRGKKRRCVAGWGHLLDEVAHYHYERRSGIGRSVL